MADIVLSVDFSTLKQAQSQLDKLKATVKGFPVNSLVSGLSGLEGKIKQLVDAQSKGTIKAKEYNLGLLDVKRAYEQLGLSSQQATARVRAYAAELQRQAAAKEAARAARELARAQEEAARATAKLAAERDRLRQKFDPLYSASQLYQRSLAEIDRAHEIGAISAKKQQQAVDALNAEYQQFQDGVATFSNRFVQHMNQASNGVNKFGFYAQQFGYQVGDFFVQIQSGTNFLVAFGQQATQLAGLIPGIWGAAIGIGISVITALGAALFRTAEQSKTLKEQLTELKSAVDAVNNSAKQYSTSGIEALIEKYGQLDAQVLSLLENQTKYNQLVAQKELKDSLQSLQDAVGSRWYDIGISDLQSSILNLKETLNITTNDAKVLRGAFDDLAEAQTYDEQLTALTTLNGYLGTIISSQENVTDEMLAVYDATIKATDAVKILANSAPSANWMQGAINGVTSLGEAIRARIGEAIKLATLANAPGMTTGNLDWAKNELGFILPGEELLNLPKPPKETSGSGGGSGGSTIDPMEKLLKQIERQRELLTLDQQQIALKKELWRIEDALGESAGKYSTEKLTAIAKENLAIEAQLKLQEDQQRAMDNLANTMAQSVGDAFMSIVDGTSSVKDAFKQMAADIIKQLLQVLVVQRLVGSWDKSTGVGSGLAGFFGKLLNFEGGGYTGSGGRSGGLDGKGGFLAMVHPDETIIDHTKRKQVAPAAKPASVGSSEAPVVVNQYFNLSANGDDSVRRIVKEEAPKLAQQAKAAVLDARRRGGSYGKAF